MVPAGKSTVMRACSGCFGGYLGSFGAVEWDLSDLKVDQCFVMNVFLPPSLLLSVAVRLHRLLLAEALQLEEMAPWRAVLSLQHSRRTRKKHPFLPSRPSLWSKGLSPQHLLPAVYFQQSWFNFASKMKLNTDDHRVQSSSHGALRYTSFIEQPGAALPYVAVRMAGGVHDYRSVF